jgi:hypothetical protein
MNPTSTTWNEANDFGGENNLTIQVQDGGHEGMKHECIAVGETQVNCLNDFS